MKQNVKVEEKKKTDISKNGIGAAMPAAVSKTDDTQNKKMADEVNMYKNKLLILRNRLTILKRKL